MNENEYFNLDYAPLSPSETLEELGCWLDIQRKIQEEMKVSYALIEEQGGWAWVSTTEEEKEKMWSLQYLQDVVRQSQWLYGKAEKEISLVLMEAPSGVQPYHVAKLLRLSQEAEPILQDLKSSWREGRWLPHEHPAYSRLDILMDEECFQSFYIYADLGRIAERLKREVGKAIGTSSPLKKDGDVAAQTPAPKKVIERKAAKGFHYQDTLTEFDKKNISRLDENGEVAYSEGFNSSSIFLLWKLFAENIGKPLEKEKILHYLDEQGAEYYTLPKLHENLIAKLRRVTGLSQKELRSWFQADETTLSLKK